MYLGSSSPQSVPLGCYPNWDLIDCGVRRSTPASLNTFIILGFQVEGVGVQCGVPVLRLSDRPGQQALVPVLVAVVGPWEVVGGHRYPAHPEPHGSLESGSPLCQPPTMCEMFHCGSGPPLSVES